MPDDILIPTTLLEFCNLFPTAESCEAYLIQVRWPNGFVCPKCGEKQDDKVVVQEKKRL